LLKKLKEGNSQPVGVVLPNSYEESLQAVTGALIDRSREAVLVALEGNRRLGIVPLQGLAEVTAEQKWDLAMEYLWLFLESIKRKVAYFRDPDTSEAVVDQLYRRTLPVLAGLMFQTDLERYFEEKGVAAELPDQIRSFYWNHYQEAQADYKDLADPLTEVLDHSGTFRIGEFPKDNWVTDENTLHTKFARRACHVFRQELESMSINGGILILVFLKLHNFGSPVGDTTASADISTMAHHLAMVSESRK
jgi:hypothetical protein